MRRYATSAGSTLRSPLWLVQCYFQHGYSVIILRTKGAPARQSFLPSLPSSRPKLLTSVPTDYLSERTNHSLPSSPRLILIVISTSHIGESPPSTTPSPTEYIPLLDSVDNKSLHLPSPLASQAAASCLPKNMYPIPPSVSSLRSRPRSLDPPVKSALFNLTRAIDPS